MKALFVLGVIVLLIVLGFVFSTIRCPKCKSDAVIPISSSTVWMCYKCNHIFFIWDSPNEAAKR